MLKWYIKIKEDSALNEMAGDIMELVKVIPPDGIYARYEGDFGGGIFIPNKEFDYLNHDCDHEVHGE